MTAPQEKKKERKHTEISNFPAKLVDCLLWKYKSKMNQCKNHCVLVFEDMSLNAQLEFLVSQEL